MKQQQQQKNRRVFALVFIILLVIYFYSTREGYHPPTSHGNHDGSVESKIQSIATKMNQYMETASSMTEHQRLAKISSLGMEAHHLEGMYPTNPVTKILHQSVAHDLLQIDFVFDSIIKIINSGKANKPQLEQLIEMIKSTPDKNFNPETKKK